MSNDKTDNESNNKSDEKFDKVFDQNNTPLARTVFILAYNITYNRKKLVRILSREIVLPKQQWGINSILTTLTYY